MQAHSLLVSCLQVTTPGSCLKHVLSYVELTRTSGCLQPAAPTFFQWLNSRLSSVRVLNVECSARFFRQGGFPGPAWALPLRARLAPPPPTDGAAPLCAVRLVALPHCHFIDAQSWLSSVAVYYQQLTALCLKGIDVNLLPVMPQLQVLMYGYAGCELTHSLLESAACQPRLVSLQLLEAWPKGWGPGSVLRPHDMMRLVFLRLDLHYLTAKNFTFAENVALPERCSVALTLTNPTVLFSRLNLRAFTFLKSLCIEWMYQCPGPTAQPSRLLAALSPTVESVDITCPEGFRISRRLTLPQTLMALRLRVDGRAGGQTPLCLSMHAGMQRLTLQLWGGHIVFSGLRAAFQSLTDMHVEAATASLGPHLDVIVQERGQLTTRVPDKREIYGGGGGQPVQVAHMGPWPPSMPGYKGPDVPEARACCYWPCACGSCESCCKAAIWRAPGSS